MAYRQRIHHCCPTMKIIDYDIGNVNPTYVIGNDKINKKP